MSKGKAKAKVEVTPKPKRTGGGKTEYLNAIAMRYADSRTARQKAISATHKVKQKF